MAGSTDMLRGRNVVLLMTNKSGGSVAAGDVVIIDTGNDNAFTTTTSGQSTSAIGVVMESIANNATGRVQVSGYVPLINVPASVTRGHFIETHTVAKQAVGNATRRLGTFGQFLTGGTTPTGFLWGRPEVTTAGSGMATDTLADAKGDAFYGTGADTIGKLAVGSNGQVNQADSSQSTGWKNAWPPGYEFDRAAYTGGSLSVTGTAEGSETTVLSGNSFTAPGSVPMWVTFSCTRFDWTAGAAGRFAFILLYEASTLIGRIGLIAGTNGVQLSVPIYTRVRVTPASGSRQYIVKAYKSNAGDSLAIIGASGGAAAHLPAELTVTAV